MSMEPPIVLRLSLESMQWQIVQALYPREVELKETIERVVASVINDFNFEVEIARQVQSALHSKIQRKVEYAVNEALLKQRIPDLDKMIEKTVQAEIKRQGRKSQ